MSASRAHKRLALSMGDLHYEVAIEDGRSILTDSILPTENFVSTGSPREAVIPVTATVAGHIEAPSTTRIFDAGHPWSMYAGGHADRQTRAFVLHGRAQQPIAVAHFETAPSTVRIECSAVFALSDERVLNPFAYPIDQILAMYALAARGGLLVHATGVVVDGAAHVFCGRSRAGKSTIARLLSQHEGVELLSDDRLILRCHDGRWVAYGTPWPGEAGLALNRWAPVAALSFLRKDVAHAVTPISPAEAVAQLLPVASIPWFDQAVVGQMLETAHGLVRALPTRVLAFARKGGVLDVIRQIA